MATNCALPIYEAPEDIYARALEKITLAFENVRRERDSLRRHIREAVREKSELLTELTKARARIQKMNEDRCVEIGHSGVIGSDGGVCSTCGKQVP